MSSHSHLRQEILEIRSELKRVSDRLEALLTYLENRSDLSLKDDSDRRIGVFSLLSLPDYLRKSVVALSGFDEATAGDIAKNTGRTRAAESLHLNQLHNMGYVKKVRRGRIVYFSLKEEKT